MPLLRPAGAKPRRLVLVLVAGGGLVSFLALAATPHDGLHPLALMAALLPLQLAALAWAGMHRR